MITFSKFGRHGNLGNQLFQYAALIGLCKMYGHQLFLPAWQYSDFFEAQFPQSQPTHKWQWQFDNEPHFHYALDHYHRLLDDETKNFDLLGWFQSEKYWDVCKEDVKAALTFKPSFIEEVKNKYTQKVPLQGDLRGSIAISIRRGDYVDNPNYYQLPIDYYLHALYENFPDWKERHIIIFSDDFHYCKIHFAAASNVAYAEGLNAIEQLCLMSLCKDFIIANSTFSWWGAYLAELQRPCTTIVVRPNHHFAGKLQQSSDWSDYYPNRWINFEHEGKKFDLTNTTFTVPVSYDHPHRKQNLDLNICMLQRSFKTHIIIGEQGNNPQFHYMAQWCKYHYFHGMKEFHRTKMLNDMAHMATTDIIVNWDADVFLPPLSILISVERMCPPCSKDTPDFIYPYDGRFARVQRPWHKQLEQKLDLGIFRDMKFPGTNENDPLSVGGAVFCNKQAFIEAGMENEHMISYAPEDRERFLRFTKLGYIVERIPGPIYHLDHWRGPNSSSANTFFQKNNALYQQYKSFSKEQWQQEIKSWEWVHRTSYLVPRTSHGIDVVIPLGKGSTWKNNELRYCLRSIHQHLKGYRNIYIIGVAPDYILAKCNFTAQENIQQDHYLIPIFMPDGAPNNPAKNIYQKLLFASFLNEVSENFLMFNDDYFLIQDTDAATIPHYYKPQNLQECIKKMQPGNTFRTAVENTVKALQEKGHELKYFDIHVPMLYNKQQFAQVMQQYNWAVPYGYTAKSLYCNSLGIAGQELADCKIDHSLTTAEIEQWISGRFVFSVGDAGLFGDMKQWLQQRFPHPSPYE